MQPTQPISAAEPTAAPASGRTAGPPGGAVPSEPMARAHREALLRRGAQRSPGVQRALQRRWQAQGAAAVQAGDWSASVTHVPTPPALPALAHTQPPAPLSPLGQLLRYIDERAGVAHHPTQGMGAPVPPARIDPNPALDLALHVAPPAPELRALRQDGALWARLRVQLRVQQQLQQSMAQAPEQAGPLNSHGLVLRTLQALQALSPAYLARFMGQMDALFALEQGPSATLRPAAGAGPTRPAAQGKRDQRAKRPATPQTGRD